MKIKILLGRGIEGCGVTRFATELQNYLISEGHDCKSYASSDKKWGRAKHQNTNIIEFSNDQIDSIKKELNDSDIVYYQSLPSRTHSDEYKEKFFEKLVVDVVNPVKIIFQNDHKMGSLSRNYRIWDIVKEMDCAFTFSEGTAFYKRVKKEQIDIPIKIFNNGHDFSQLSHMWKKQQRRIFSYLGRFAGFKDPNRMHKLFPLLTKHGLICEMRGIERSLGAKSGFFSSIEGDMKSPEHEHILYRGKSVVDEQDLNHLHVYGPYERIPTLELLSNNMFGANFFNLGDDEYGNILEYTTLEMINIGMIVAVDKQWAMNNYHIQGDSFYDLDCFVYSDANDLYTTEKQVVELMNNTEYRNNKRLKALRIAKSHCSTDIAFKDLLNKSIDTDKKVKKQLSMF
jgi:hypothetical protein